MGKTKTTDYDKADEVYRLKREKGTSWDYVYKMYKVNGGVKRYKTAKSLYGAIKRGNVPDIDMLIEELKQIEVIKEPKPKKKPKKKPKTRPFRCAEDYRERRLIKNYSIENGILLQREYLE